MEKKRNIGYVKAINIPKINRNLQYQNPKFVKIGTYKNSWQMWLWDATPDTCGRIFCNTQPDIHCESHENENA